MTMTFSQSGIRRGHDVVAMSLHIGRDEDVNS